MRCVQKTSTWIVLDQCPLSIRSSRGPHETLKDVVCFSCISQQQVASVHLLYMDNGCCAIISPTVLIRGETTYTRQEITQGDEVRAENISFVVLTAEAVLATTGLHTHSRVQIHDDEEAEGVSWSSREAGISRTHMNTFNLQRSRCWSQPDPVGFTAHGHGRVQPAKREVRKNET